VHVPKFNVQLTLTELNELIDCVPKFTLTVPPGGAHELPEAGGCKLKSCTARVKGTEAGLGPLATITLKGQRNSRRTLTSYSPFSSSLETPYAAPG
jgi:hypothetical protein